MQRIVLNPGAVVWIRQTRWRVEHCRRERGVVRLDVSGRQGRRTFLAPFDRPVATERGRRAQRVRAQSFLARLARLVSRARSYRSLASAVNAHLEILPFQLEPAFAMFAGARRLLIADEVGLGKTIQAGLLIAELRRRQPAARVLILAPSALRGQWADELRERFTIDGRQAEGSALERFARLGGRDDVPWDRPGVWIASVDYVKQPHVFSGLPDQPWDLVVVDEAHGVCGHSDRRAAVAALSRSARRLVLLTATPHNGDETKFERLLDLGALGVERDHVVIFRRTRDGLGLRINRRVRWHSVRLSPEECELLDVLQRFERAVLRAAGEKRRDGALLLLSVFRKRALSTIDAFLSSVDRRLTWLERTGRGADAPWRQPRLDFGVCEDDFGEDESVSLVGEVGLEPDRERSWLRRLREAGRRAARRESKIRHVVSIVSRSAEPIVIFTEFKDSLDALAARVRAIRPTSILHGRLSADEQREQIGRFLAGSTSLLLATDVASQGLNLHTRCRWVVNLDVPWQPARLEQRAGRVDRIGQRRPVHVSVVAARHDAETGLLARLARRALAAQRRLGADVLRDSSPAEATIRAHILAGNVVAPPGPDRRPVPLCTRWSRHARCAARGLRRERAWAARWRSDSPLGRPCATALARLPWVRQLAGHGTLLVFTVPLLDRSGALLERRLAIVRASPEALDAPRMMAEIARLVCARTGSRVRRLQRLRHLEMANSMRVERAIGADLSAISGPAEAQAGLFDRRDLNAADRAEHERAARSADLEIRIGALRELEHVAAGQPVLELIAWPVPTCFTTPPRQ